MPFACQTAEFAVSDALLTVHASCLSRWLTLAVTQSDQQCTFSFSHPSQLGSPHCQYTGHDTHVLMMQGSLPHTGCFTRACCHAATRTAADKQSQHCTNTVCNTSAPPILMIPPALCQQQYITKYEPTAAVQLILLSEQHITVHLLQSSVRSASKQNEYH
jgi:hypothetical protein